MSKNKQRTIPAAEFKAKCLKVMETVRATGEEVVITKHGKPVARLVPVEYPSRPLFGRNAGLTIYEGDVISPIDVEWEAERG